MISVIVVRSDAVIAPSLLKSPDKTPVLCAEALWHERSASDKNRYFFIDLQNCVGGWDVCRVNAIDRLLCVSRLAPQR